MPLQLKTMLRLRSAWNGARWIIYEPCWWYQSCNNRPCGGPQAAPPTCCTYRHTHFGAGLYHMMASPHASPYQPQPQLRQDSRSTPNNWCTNSGCVLPSKQGQPPQQLGPTGVPRFRLQTCGAGACAFGRTLHLLHMFMAHPVNIPQPHWRSGGFQG